MNRKSKGLLSLFTVAVVTMHVINRLETSRSTAQNILTSVEHRSFQWRFGKINYIKKGTGTPILLLHDLTPGSSSYEFSEIIEDLSKRNTVYCPDLLGYGTSDKPDITYTNYLYVQLITDFIKKVIGKKADIITSGESFPIALMSCHNDHEIIKRIVAINPPSLYEMNQIPSRQTKTLKMLLQIPVVGTFIYHLHTGRESFRKTFIDDKFYKFEESNEKIIDAYVEAAHISGHHSKASYASHIGRYTNTNILHALKEVDNSIFLLLGKEKEDNKILAENYRFYNSAIESSYLPKTKQLPHLEAPSEVVKTLSVYLN